MTSMSDLATVKSRYYNFPSPEDQRERGELKTRIFSILEANKPHGFNLTHVFYHPAMVQSSGLDVLSVTFYNENIRIPVRIQRGISSPEKCAERIIAEMQRGLSDPH